jgi:hypothetical protein
LTEVWDELDEPLGFVASSGPAPVVRNKRPMRGVAIVTTILAVGVGMVVLPRPDLPAKSQPFAVAKVEILPAPPKLVAPDTTASMVQTPATPGVSAAQVETTDGVKITGGPGGPPKPLIINVAQALAAQRPPDSSAPDKSKYGVLPKTAH